MQLCPPYKGFTHGKYQNSESLLTELARQRASDVQIATLFVYFFNEKVFLFFKIFLVNFFSHLFLLAGG